MAPLVLARRNEVNVQLNLISGLIPNDIDGYVFFNSPCGTVNSNGLPFPPDQPGQILAEYGSPVFNGDAMLLRFDLSTPGQVHLRSRMLRTPCYYADEATRDGNTNGYDPLSWGFKMLGIGRTSFRLGARNQLNTAVNPVIFPGDQYVRMTANFDMGRPWEIDTQTMDLKTAIGTTAEWRGEIPSIASFPFQLHQTTAHPCFDPHTNEFFTVNFTKTFETMFLYQHFAHLMTLPVIAAIIEESLESRVQAMWDAAQQNGFLPEEVEDHIDEINDFYQNVDSYIDIPGNWIVQVLHFFGRIWRRIRRTVLRIADFLLGMKDRVYLLRWNGIDIRRWLVIDDDTGRPIRIEQCMHQNNLCEDYIVLSDSAFKFAADIMISNPFPGNDNLERMLRDLTSMAQLPHTPLYIIKRSDLPNAPRRFIFFGIRMARARRVVIDLETVHFSINYRNPNNQITLHTAHNAASCAAEWVRHYDALATPGFGTPDLANLTNNNVYPNTVGLMTCGEMDIGRIGRYVIDGETGQIDETQSELIWQTGLNNLGNMVGAHTWAIALHTHRDIISATRTVDEIRYIYWQSYGTDPRYLTDFIERLYHEYEHRIIDVPDMITENQVWRPYCLLRQDTVNMQIDDYHLFERNELLRSIQFVPRQYSGAPPDGVEPQTDGYIMCTMLVGTIDDIAADDHIPEIWFFDANDLIGGPVCRLSHPEMTFAYTIHSAWIEECVGQPNTPYNIDVQEDLQRVINRMWFSGKRQEFTAFMEQHVYPHF